MKFGLYLESQARPEWIEHYVDYKGLKKLIKSSIQEGAADGYGSPRNTSLSIARDPKIAAEEQFHIRLDDEMEKVGEFTQEMVVMLRAAIKSLTTRLNKGAQPAGILREVRQVDRELLALEKYAVLNYMACHKILKKHDRHRPGAPVQQFYLQHLHRKPWVNGYFRDLMPSLSALYARLKARPESSPQLSAAPPSTQGFLHHMRSFWVTAEDLPVVRHHLMQNIPIQPPPDGGPCQADEEVHTLYLDNTLMELYHNRLFDRPKSMTLKVTWKGEVAPEWVDLERCTFQEGWKREAPLLEAIPLKYSQLYTFLQGEYNADAALDDLEEAGRGVSDAAQCAQYHNLHSSMQKMVNSKQLLPVVRTIAVRTTLQAPQDPRVRVTLDSQMMFRQEDELGGQVVEQLSFNWMDTSTPGSTPPGSSFANPSPHSPLRRPTSTFHTLPYALLQVSMYLQDGEEQPRWLSELWEAGYLSEIYEFSTFLHGCAELYPEILRALPYWVDDPGLKAARERAARRRSMIASSPTRGSTRSMRGSDCDATDGPPGLNRLSPLKALLSFGSGGHSRSSSANQRDLQTWTSAETGLARTSSAAWPQAGSGGLTSSGSGPAAWILGIVGAAHATTPPSQHSTPPRSGSLSPRKPPARVSSFLRPRKPLRIANYEPTAFMQNERVFNAWLYMAIQTAAIATAMLGFSSSAYRDPLWDGQRIHVVTSISLILLPIACLICMYAIGIFVWRRHCIRHNRWEYFHDQLGPMIMAFIIAVAMACIMTLCIMDWWETHEHKKKKKKHRHRSPPMPPHPHARPSPHQPPASLVEWLLPPS